MRTNQIKCPQGCKGNVSYEVDEVARLVNFKCAVCGHRWNIPAVIEPPSPITVSPNQPGGLDLLRRMFEPEPVDARFKFRPDDRVRLSRPDSFGFIPLGAEGVVKGLDDPESINSMKGRPYAVEFDLRPFNLPLPDEIRRLIIAQGVSESDIPAVQQFATTFKGALDLEMIEHGPNWHEDSGYEHPYPNEYSTYELEQAYRASLEDAGIKTGGGPRVSCPNCGMPHYNGSCVFCGLNMPEISLFPPLNKPPAAPRLDD